MPPLSIPQTGLDWNWAYLVLGRALYVACEFEGQCRSLAFILKLNEPQPGGRSDDAFFEALTKLVNKYRLNDFNTLIAGRAKLAEDYVDMLDAAREARNYVAHEAAEELDRLAKLTGGFDQWREIMASKLRDIGLGRLIVAILLSRNSAEETPLREDINAYRETIESWALSRSA
ncbi:hypothetical protein [Cupriavidus plantarum]|uniref:Uncharacterized protein n=1 Tax=Cupriavidus plantarum TaxID=942865 RepID=A0A316ESF7_9BURK|nr:hypothetical protein [Cupriavidus plantarum]PWK33498.1 hypothetical protein C7419_104173 [Cupriavidus plantarum]